MRGLGTIQLRLSGESGMIAAIFLGLKERMPRGPRGGSLYRLSLRENTDGVSSRLCCDLTPAVFADLFQCAAVARPQDTANPAPANRKATSLARPVPVLQPPRYNSATGGSRATRTRHDRSARRIHPSEFL